MFIQLGKSKYKLYKILSVYNHYNDVMNFSSCYVQVHVSPVVMNFSVCII